MTQALPPGEKRDRDRVVRKQRWQFVATTKQILELPMIVLGFVWMFLVIYSVAHPASRPAFEPILAVIWYLFLAEFLMRAMVAPSKREFLKHNWISAISMLLPALRTLQVFHALSGLGTLAHFYSADGILVPLLTGVNRGMTALRRLFVRRRSGYVMILTVIVLFAGAAGMLAAEHSVNAPNGIHDYPGALYWTTMLLTTIGSDYWPQTPQGKTLCVVLSAYALGILSYIAATLASFFIGKDARDDGGDIASDKQVRELRKQIAMLQQELRDCMQKD